MAIATFHPPSTGSPLPSAEELYAVGRRGASASRSHRAALMNQIGASVGIPPFGWNHGQARLFAAGDIRLVWLLRRCAVRAAAEHIARNLRPLGSLAGADIMLSVVTTAREASTAALTDLSLRPIETWHQGGLDYLGANLHNLGLPRSVVERWAASAPVFSHETHKFTAPAVIPARDQLLAYGAQIRASWDHHFRGNLARVAGPEAAPVLGVASRPALLVWKALSFLAPGGEMYDDRKTISAQSGQKFGHRTALQYLAATARRRTRRLDLDEITTNDQLSHVECVRSARIRAAEAMFLERLLTAVRERVPLSGLD